MRYGLARFVISIALMLASAACGSGGGTPAEDARGVQGTAAAMTTTAQGASTSAAASTETNTPKATATPGPTKTPVPTSANRVPRQPLSAVSRGTFWEANCEAGTVTLLWQDQADETGYRVYRNGAVIADQPADHVNYVDSIAPAMGTVAYEIRAYNENGESEPLRTAKLSC